MSKWWEVASEVPDGTAENSVIRYIVAADDKKDAHKKAVDELSRKYPRVRVVEVRPLADDEEDETVGGFDENGALPRDEKHAAKHPRLST